MSVNGRKNPVAMMTSDYQEWVNQVFREYSQENRWIPFTSVICGILACKLVYDISKTISPSLFKSYSSLPKTKKIEWDNRAISSVHAIFITVLSIYLAFWSDLFADDPRCGPVLFRSSAFSTFVLGTSDDPPHPHLGRRKLVTGAHYTNSREDRPPEQDENGHSTPLSPDGGPWIELDGAVGAAWSLFYHFNYLRNRFEAPGVSVGYFISDLAMIFWFYPALGGTEYVVHHFLSMAALGYAMSTGKGQFYTYMVLLSETTTPGINLRWYLDVVGKKKSKSYVVNGVAIFLTWLVARILLFLYVFYHICAHFDQDYPAADMMQSEGKQNYAAAHYWILPHFNCPVCARGVELDMVFQDNEGNDQDIDSKDGLRKTAKAFTRSTDMCICFVNE
ncbi:hypothetical protein Cgig2_005208 [Carnegiea gigantea]|uniref:TLC domain-containing protein n=1 Tax=Carnegiea gigantea TaxID=171969 RepID=A0A9Q1Q778_9CARY|nr:hypothetical protein Cgig2_005208 [Carnegiea gigantea]